MCPAYGTKGEACGKYNHWKAVCRSCSGIKPDGHEQPKNWRQKKRENIHAIDTADQSAEVPPPDSTNTPHMLDTAQLHFNSSFQGHTIPHYDISQLTLSHHGHSKLYIFHVVNTVGPTILGLPTFVI